MTAFIIVFLFFFIVFAPCLVATGAAESKHQGKLFSADWKRPQPEGLLPLTPRVGLVEASLADDFEIRSFPKGVAQRRLLIRDGESEAKLTISQLREAAAELIKLGGMQAAYEFALVVAALAVAAKSIKNAFELAAQRVMEAAYASSAWIDAHEAPRLPPIHLDLPPLTLAGRWSEVSQAA